MYYIYVLESLKDHKHYYGLTRNLQNRIEKHNAGEVKSTKSRRPFSLIYYEEAVSLNEARKREKYFKSGFGRKYIKNKITALSSNG